MKKLFIFGLLILSLVSAEELNFLSDFPEEDYVDVSNGGFDSFMGGAGAIVGIAEKLIDIFRSSKSSVIKSRIEGKGYSYFRGGCTVRSMRGLLIGKYEEFLNSLLKRIKVPSENIKGIKGQMEDLLDSDQGIAFKTYNLVFNAESTANDNCNSFSFSAAYNEKGNLDIFYSNMQSDFKLAPDVMIMNESRSFVGGFYSDTEDKIIKTPKDITHEEIKLVIAFFEYVGLELFADFMGIKIPKL